MRYEELVDFLKKLNRADFIDNEYKKYARIDQPLPIGFEQTISQPSLVLQMTLLLKLNKECKVLEIGTGSGYQTAILAQFAKHVFTVERISELSKAAQERLERMGFKNISYKIGDGSEGWAENAFYDRIIVTAAAGRYPRELVSQLNKNGIMVAPVGKRNIQDLLLITKDEDGNVKVEDIEKVRFVELKGKYGWDGV